MAYKILIMGLPGSGKTTLAVELIQRLKDHQIEPEWINADVIRTKHNDWDFSPAGRIRQSERLVAAADQSIHLCVVCDFIAALPVQRIIFSPDYLIWMDTIKQGRYQDTNFAFIPPKQFDFKVLTLNAKHWANEICDDIVKRTMPQPNQNQQMYP